MSALRWGSVAFVTLSVAIPGVAKAATTNSIRSTTAAVGTKVHNVTSSLSAPLAPKTATRTSAAPFASSGRVAAASTSTAAVPAPSGQADAYAAKVGGIISLSHTHASAGPGGPSSTADALELLGTVPAPLGGTQTGPGSSSGSLLDSGNKIPMAHLALAPWSVDNSSSASGNSASGLADMVLLDLGNPGTAESISLKVLQSQSSASWTQAASSAQGSSDGAILDVGGPSGLLVDVLHSQTSSSGAGSSYLISINGNEIGTSGQTNGACALTIPGILSLSCLTASGGLGLPGAAGQTVRSSAAGVLSTTLGGTTTGLTAGVIQSSSSTGTGTAGTNGGGNNNGGGNGNTNSGGSTASKGSTAPAAGPAAPVVATGHLAFTGSDLAGAFAIGGSAIGAGLILVAAVRRRRNPAADPETADPEAYVA